ncbi:MAG TPA: hypothetical protein PLL62_03615 [Candidatus Saccharicenans sp.]|nr:hypothetical protein [Candidatus Saccharicenans sp.]HQM74312.1 hypothetical protein [Candidatus Saccharicenans sp.]
MKSIRIKSRIKLKTGPKRLPNKYIFFSVIWLALLSLRPVLIQAGTVQFSLVQHSTTNIFQTYQPVSDWLTAGNLSFGGDSSSLSLYGGLDFNYLYKYSGLSSIGGQLGVDYLIPAGSKSAFYLAAEGQGVLFRDLYNNFNHAGLKLIASFKSYLTPATVLRLESQSTYRRYQLGIFDYFSEMVNLSLDHYFKTRTTVKVEASYGYKYFYHPGEIALIEEETTPVATISSSTSVHSRSSINQAAGFFVAQQGGPGGGHGHPADNYKQGGSYSLRGIPYQTVYYTDQRSIQMVTVSGLLAQGLGDRVGLSLGGMKQWNLKGENPFSASDEYYSVENPTSDLFSWQGTGLKVKLTASLTDRLQAEIQYDYLNREFPGLESLDLEGVSLGVIREDRRHQLSTLVQLDLARVSFFVSYSYISNASNDPWFDWSGNFISGGLKWNLSVSKSKQ